MVFLGETKKSRFSHPHTNALPAFGWDESDAALAATIPFDGYARPILFNDGCLLYIVDSIEPPDEAPGLNAVASEVNLLELNEPSYEIRCGRPDRREALKPLGVLGIGFCG